MKIFKNRKSAGLLLVKRLKNIKADLVLGIPRGGVVVAFEVAKAYKLPLDILVTRKIGAPGQEELALGAVDPDGEIVYDKSLIHQYQISNIKYQKDETTKEIKRREKVYRHGKKPLEINNKIIILVDDGIATGATTISAIKYLIRHKVRKIILSVPVISIEALKKVQKELENFGEVITLEIPEDFQAVGQFYYEFAPVTDQEVVQLIQNGS